MAAAPPPLSVVVATFNAGAELPPPPSTLRAWLRPTDAAPPLGDVYVLGLQEIVELNVNNILLTDSTSDAAINEWQDAVQSALGPAFHCVSALSVVGTALVAFVRADLQEEAIASTISSKLHLAEVAGISLGNKAAIGLTFSVRRFSLAFVCAHLPAHRNKASNRQQAIGDVWENLVFIGREAATGQTCEVALKDLVTDYTFFCGDLNSRMRWDVPTDDVWRVLDAAKQEEGPPTLTLTPPQP